MQKKGERQLRYKVLSGRGCEFTERFLSLPKKLYSKKEITQDEITERQILCGEHVLSENFSVVPYIVTDERGEVVSRCILTLYPENDTAFLGFFESINDLEACRIMMNEVCRCASDKKKKSIVGPVDSSFWIKYRFKADRFDAPPYACEPYNKDYYIELWEKCGFSVSERYFSNQIRIPLKTDENKKCQKRYETMTKKGYRIEYPDAESFMVKLHEVFSLLIRLYAGFPCFTEITWEQFRSMFSDLKYVLNYDMVKLVYKDEKLVGFSISIPDFGNNTCGKITLMKKIKILSTKLFPQKYINIYMGVDADHLGLGSMLAESIKRSLAERKCSAISALIHEGKVTGSYYNKELSVGRYHYVLLNRELADF